MRKVKLFIASSLDGYIAKEDGDISFLSIVESPGEDYGYSDFIENIDTVIVGRKTFDKIKSLGVENPYSDLKVCYVITHSSKINHQNVIYYSASLLDLINNLKSEKGKDIFIDGGSETIHGLLLDNLIYEFIISYIPIMLGKGIPLFRQLDNEIKLKFLASKQFKSGLVQVHYEITK